MAKILLVKDNREGHNLVCLCFKNDHEITIVDRTSQVSKSLETSLPDRDDFRLCSEIWPQAETMDLPILFLTAQQQIEDKLSAFRVDIDNS